MEGQQLLMKKNNSIEKTLPILTRLMILILIILIVPANLAMQQYMQHMGQLESSEEVFAQLEQLIETNAESLEQEKKDFSEKCIQSAEMAAYFVEYDPSVTSSLEQTRQLAEKLDVDEIHFFTTDGRIYAGTHPEYYDYTFNSGEQMEFFLPMLEDHSLKMCQEITPNTAEGKEMQYAAVWMSDDSGIVQIGMEPRRVMQETKDKSLENVIAALPMDLRGYLHVVDTDTDTIIASTSESLVGYQLKESIHIQKSEDAVKMQHNTFNGEEYCVYVKPYKNYLLIRTYLSNYLLQNSVISTGLVVLYMILVAITVIGVIVWYVNTKLSRNLTFIVNDLKKIEKGNLENITINTNIVEFDELILYINALLKSIRLNWSKLSNVIDKGRLPLGVFEDNRFYKKTFINERMLDILKVKKRALYSTDDLAEVVRRKIRQAEAKKADSEEPIYEYLEDGEKSYLRIEKLTDEQSTTYYITDVSSWWNEINELREQSSRDSLTGLYNRRGLSERLDELFRDRDKIGCGALFMLDADGLKMINDIYGHSAGDEYLKQISQVIGGIAEGHSVCARLGGDEFALFLYGYQSNEEIREVVSMLERQRGELFITKDSRARASVEFSLGYALYPQDGQDYHVLMHIADENMYQEKKKRKEETL